MHNTGYDGFLGTRASLMLDVVLLAMFAVIPVLFWSIWLVKCRRNYTLHRRVQLLLGTALLVVVALFEIDVRVYGWTHRAAESRYYGSWVRPVLYVHLVFAISTTVLWILVTVRALRRFAKPPAPGDHSSSHRRLGWIASIDMLLTAITGCLFYYLAFVC